jgi:hypothetical protein
MRKTAYIMKRPLMQADAGGWKFLNMEEVGGELPARPKNGLKWLANGVGQHRLRPILPGTRAFHPPLLP